MKHLALAAVAALSLGACANMTPEQQSQAAMACSAAQVALVLAENHGVDADTLAALREDVSILCAALSPAERAEAKAMTVETLD